jgi:predicted RND superfamily exporter protein
MTGTEGNMALQDGTKVGHEIEMRETNGFLSIRSSSDFFFWFQKMLHDLFFVVGSFVQSNPRRICLYTTIFVALGSLGWMRFVVEERPEKLYTPQNSKAVEEQEWTRTNFPSDSRFITFFETPKKGANDNLLADPADTKRMVKDFFRIDKAMESGEVHSANYKLEDVCVNNRLGGCEKSSILAFWKYNETLFDVDSDVIGTLSRQNASDCCGAAKLVRPANVIGGIQRDPGGRLTHVAAFRMQWVIKEKKEKDSRRDEDLVAEEFENSYQEYVEVFSPAATGVEVSGFSKFFQQSSIRNTFAFDGILTVVSYLLITLYASFVLSNFKDPVRSRSRLGVLTVFVVGLSVVSSFGICMGLGAPFSLVVNSVIFVVLGIGVDDSFVVLEFLEKESILGTDPVWRIPNALANAGGSITLTSITDFAAFLAGSATIIPALQSFSQFAATTIMVDFLLQVTVFVAFVKWDDDRIEAGIPACPCGSPFSSQIDSVKSQRMVVPILETMTTDEKTPQVTSDGPLDRSSLALGNEGKPSLSDGTNSQEAKSDHPSGVSNESSMPSALSEEYVTKGIDRTKEIAVGKRPANDSFTRRLVTEYLPRVILQPFGKICVLACTAGLIAASCVGITRLELDFQYSWFVPSNTPAYDALQINIDYFTGEFIPVFLYTQEADYFTQRSNMINLCSDFAANSYVVEASVNCWMIRWDEAEGGIPSSSGYGSAAAFYGNLSAYINGRGAQFKENINWNTEMTAVLATKTFAQFDKIGSANGNIRSMESTRETVAPYKESLGAMVFSPPFVFWEGLAVVYYETIRNIIITLVVVYLVCIIFLADIWAATLCGMMIVLIDVCLLGFLHWFGMHMNVVTSINLLLALGLTVDYSAHLAHAYMHSPGETKDVRMRSALEKIGVSIFNGGMTTFVSIFALAAATSYVFQVFFKCFVLIIFFGLYFGMVVLPVVFSLVGPDRVFEGNRIDVPALLGLQSQEKTKSVQIA